MNGTTVACIIPHYNQLGTLRRAVESALSQCDEVIVVDDATPSEEGDIREELRDILTRDKFPFKLKLWMNARNHGVCSTRNTGALFTECDYLLPLDADDYLVRGAVSHFRPLLAGHAFVYGDWFNEPEGVYCKAAPLGRVHEKNVAKATWFVSRLLFNQVKGYDADFEQCGAEDWALMRAILKAGGKGHYVPAPLYHYTVSTEGRAMLPRQNAQEILGKMREKYGSIPA